MFKMTVLRFLPVEKHTKHEKNHGHPCNQNTNTIQAKKILGKSFFFGGGAPTYFLLNGLFTSNLRA